MNGKLDEKSEQRRGEELSPAALAGGQREGAVGSGTEPAAAAEEQPAPLFPIDETRDLRRRWDEVQAGFVDEPRRSVQQADHLVAAVMKRLAETFADEREKLEGQWDRGDEVSTEDLRIALRRYRSFFNRLLSL